MTGPFGEVLPNQPVPPAGAIAPMNNPNNTAPGTTWNYLGQHQKLTDLNTSPIAGGIIQMGARVYIAQLGRFINVDPVEGGTLNNYVYAMDPVSEYDLDGKVAPMLLALLAAAARVAAPVAAPVVVKQIGKSAAKSTGSAAVKITTRSSSKTVSPPTPKIVIDRAYSRPNNATTQAQRLSVQGGNCVTCGVNNVKMYADHKNPLVREYYSNGYIDKIRMRSLNAVQPQCAQCSNIQGGELSNFSKIMKELHGL